MVEPQWCPFCGKPLADRLGDPACDTCHLVWTDKDGHQEMCARNASWNSRYRAPIKKPFTRLPRASDGDLRALAAMVHPLFVANNWRYGVANSHVPTVEDIASTLRFLQEPSFEGQDRVDVISGRLRARASSDTSRVEFYLELSLPEVIRG